MKNLGHSYSSFHAFTNSQISGSGSALSRGLTSGYKRCRTQNSRRPGGPDRFQPIPDRPSSHETWHSRSTVPTPRSEEHTSELQSRRDLVCRLLLEKKKKKTYETLPHLE